VRAPDESCPALAVAARICALGNGVLRLVHVRTCDPPLPIAGRFYLETAGEAAAVLEEALLMAWAYGGPRATTAAVDARRSDVAAAIARQAAAWPADLIVMARLPRLAITRLVGAACPIKSCAKRVARCSPYLPGKPTASAGSFTADGHRAREPDVNPGVEGGRQLSRRRRPGAGALVSGGRAFPRQLFTGGALPGPAGP
jgi:nucleotide-binding universal stress UspA family protein